MAEAVVISVFLLVLVVLQVKEEKSIEIFSEISWIKRGIAIALAIALLVIFWQPDTVSQIKLLVFASLILFLGFVKEGLAADHLVKFGLLSGKYHDYTCIQIEETVSGKSFVSFYKKKNRFSLLFHVPTTELVTYFQKLDLACDIIVGDLPDSSVPTK